MTLNRYFAKGSGDIYKSVQFSVYCALCSQLDDFATFHTQHDAEQHYRSLGWKKTKRKGWICPECAREWAKNRDSYL